MTSKAMPLPVENDTCVHNRSVGNILPPEGASFDELMDWYAGEIRGADSMYAYDGPDRS